MRSWKSVLVCSSIKKNEKETQGRSVISDMEWSGVIEEGSS